jgi:hypothetical protein
MRWPEFCRHTAGYAPHASASARRMSAKALLMLFSKYLLICSDLSGQTLGAVSNSGQNSYLALRERGEPVLSIPTSLRNRAIAAVLDRPPSQVFSVQLAFPVPGIRLGDQLPIEALRPDR